jgi:gas vesicle protein
LREESLYSKYKIFTRSYSNLKKQKKMKTGKLVLGLLAGVAAGAVLGILFAPNKGSKTRKRILNKSGKYSQELMDKLDNISEVVSDKYDDIKSDAENIIAKGKEKYNGLKAEVKNEVL